jgi:hypothetical protein
VGSGFEPLAPHHLTRDFTTAPRQPADLELQFGVAVGFTSPPTAPGIVGGIYGVGGGSALAPVLITDGHPPSEAAPAALASTFVTSVVGAVAFTLLAANHQGRCRA